MKRSWPQFNLAAMTMLLCVFVAASMVALVALWRVNSTVWFYAILTVVLAVAAAVNLVMAEKRVLKQKPVMGRSEFFAAQTLLLLVTMMVSALIGISFSISDRVSTYPAIFGTVPVFMLFINGYVGYIENRLAERKSRGDS